MSSVSTTFAVSDVPRALLPLYEAPYPHAVTGLIRAVASHQKLAELDQGIRRMEAQRARGSTSQALEQNLPVWKQRRAEQAAALKAHFQATPSGIEACSRYHGSLVADIVFHPVIAALHRAFCDHRPVCLSPDMIWLLIAQGIANHINANSDALRPRFVKRQGRIILKVGRDDFIKGSPENPWAEVFPEFSRMIRDHIGEATHNALLAEFSTTGPAEKAAFEIVLMDTMQSYFTYLLESICGIPAITLEGTPEDWRALLGRVQRLADFDLGWWTPALEEVLRHFVEAAEGRPDPAFWRSIYKYEERSGGSEISGWINAFFCYFEEKQGDPRLMRNAKLDQGLAALCSDGSWSSGEEWMRPPGIDSYPSGLSRAPLLWDYRGERFNMELLGGFVGVAQDKATLCLRPEIGWAVRELPAKRRPRERSL